MPSNQQQQQQEQQEQQPMMNIETFALKVNVNCEGCRRKVKKILNKIEGVYMVNIDAEQQKVIVQGIVEPSAVIKKLMRSGKQAELWPQKSKQQDNNSQRKIKNRDQLVMNPNPLAVIETEGGPWGYDHQQGMVLDPREADNLLKGGVPGNYPTDINSMMQLMAIQDHHQGYDFGAAVKNNFQQFPNYACGPSGYGYPQLQLQQQQQQQQQANLLASQYNQNHPYGGSWLRANPQNMQAIMNNRMLDGYMHMHNHY